MGLGAPAGAAVLRRLEQRRRLHKVGGAFASLQKVSVFVVDLAIWLGGNDGKGIGGYKNPIGVWFFCPRKATQEKSNQCLLSLQKPYVFLSKNNTISTSICFLFSRKKWSEKKSANSGDETVEKLIILDFPAFFAIFFKGIGSFYLSRDIFPFQTNNLWVCQCH